MTPEGYQILYDALAADPKIDVLKIHPQPQVGEDKPKVEITIRGVSREPIFRILGAAGLMHNHEPPHPSPHAPSLVYFSSVIPRTRDKITLGFSDKKVA
ncbi:MAG: hypothetical protein AAB541_01110 [Patescibacteria group bacterium]